MPTCAETVFVRSACRVNPKAGAKVSRGRRAEARDVLHLERRAAAEARVSVCARAESVGVPSTASANAFLHETCDW